MNNHSKVQNNSERQLQKKPVNKANTLSGIGLVIIVVGLLGFSISNVSANELVQASVSYGGIKSQLDKETRNLVIAQNSNTAIYDQLMGKAKRKSRTEIIAEKMSTLPTTTEKKHGGITKSFAPASSRYYTPEFSIYDAVSFLEDDIDGDGYYQTFGVVFDADVYNPNGEERSVIYAELYLSSDGVNWEHYYTTDDFLIQGSSEDDKFEVITTLAEGYATNNYDILIDIYEVGYPEIVATYSSDNNSALYALPLESADYDEVYVEEVIIVHGGSSSIAFVLFGLMIVCLKRVKIKALIK